MEMETINYSTSSSGSYTRSNLNSSSSSNLIDEDRLTIWNYTALAKWLSMCGIVVFTADLANLSKHTTFFRTRVVPALLPLTFILSTIAQDVFCYGALSGCNRVGPLYGPKNVTYNGRTIYVWVGLVICISALHANMLTFARTGKLESLFHQIPDVPFYEKKVRRTILTWVATWVIMVIFALVSTTAFLIFGSKGCSASHYICLIPQVIQILSGLSMVVTGVGLTYLVSVLVNINIQYTQEKNITYISSGNLRGHLAEHVTLKERLKQLGKDTQLGNATAFIGSCICIFGSLWAFSEDYVDTNLGYPVIFSFPLWTFIISLVLTFISVFSFSNVTKACDNMLEATKDQLGQYVLKKETQTVSLSECFLMISTYQQRFGFEIMGILVEPEIVRAGASAGITAAAAILKLAL